MEVKTIAVIGAGTMGRGVYDYTQHDAHHGKP